MSSNVRKFLVFFGLVGLGWAAYAWLQASKPEPRARGAGGQRGTAVRVITATPITVTPSARGFGVVRAKRTWQGQALAGGTIVEVAEGLEVGRTVRKGTVLFRIDPGTYELERSRTEASVQGVNAQIEELEARIAGARSALRVENQLLTLARRDLARAKTLRKDGVLSQSDLEVAERTVLNADKSVRTMQNTLAQLPETRKVLEAQLAQLQAGVEGAQMNVGKTVVVAPFTMRIAEVHASLHQNVAAGALVVVGFGRDVMDVPAQVPIGTMGPLLGRLAQSNADQPPVESLGAQLGQDEDEDAGFDEGEDEGEDAGVVSDAAPAPPKKLTKKQQAAAEAAAAEAAEAAAAQAAAEAKAAAAAVAERRAARAAAREARLARIQATVKLRSMDVENEWSGRFRRFEGIDPATRTMVVVVEVERQRRRRGAAADEPAEADGGTEVRTRAARLLPGMHVEVYLEGAPREDCVAIPRTALHGDIVYVVGPGDRLEPREVETDLLQETFACVSSGLRAGDKVVLDDLTPAVAGMLLSPRTDPLAAQRLQGDQAPSDEARGVGARPGAKDGAGRERGQGRRRGAKGGERARGADQP